MKRILLLIGALVAVAALILTISAVRKAEDEAVLWDEAFGEEPT